MATPGIWKLLLKDITGMMTVANTVKGRGRNTRTFKIRTMNVYGFSTMQEKWEEIGRMCVEQILDVFAIS